MKKITFILIFAFNSYVNSLEGVDECSEFINLVNSESETNYFSYPDEYELPRLFFTNEPTSYGYDSEPVYKRDKNNRVFINYINGKVLIKVIVLMVFQRINKHMK